MVNLESVDYASFPKFADARGEIAVVEPGDCLYVPDRWWRHEHGLTSRHAQCEIRTGVGGRIRTRAQTTLRCGRATEERVCDAVGVAAAKTWVNVFAEGEEAAWCDLSTVDGAARCRLAREIRDEIDLGLPPPRSNRDDANVNAAKTTTTTTTTTTTRPRLNVVGPSSTSTPRSRAMGGVFCAARGRTDGTHGMARRRVRRSALSLRRSRREERNERGWRRPSATRTRTRSGATLPRNARRWPASREPNSSNGTPPPRTSRRRVARVDDRRVWRWRFRTAGR